MVYLLYDLTLLVAGLFLLPYVFFKGLPYGHGLAGIRQRLGLYPAADLQALRGNKVFWIHAVSVGEVRASLPLVKALKRQFPDSRIVLSGMTFTGHQVARAADGVDLAVFFPFDFSPIVKRALRAVNPDLIVIIETEIWPNFIRLAKRGGIPLVLANGRISQKSFPRYLALKKFVRPLLEKFSVIAMQDAAGARRIRALGAPAQLVQVTGNMKFDLPLTTAGPVDPAQHDVLSDMLRGKFVWVGGSIRSGEAEILLHCHRTLIEQGIPSFLILAPRHPHRFSTVAELLKKEAVPFVQRSSLAAAAPVAEETQVLLVDTVGELTRFYALGQAIFVGASLVPLGGHNLLEPAQLGKPVLFGPHIFNFKEIAKLLLECGAGLKVNSGEELVEKLAVLFADQALRTEMGRAGLALIRDNVGATERTLASIRTIVES
jgi:3-deoxy-D-manno-octulosonic-acid transferase